MRKPTEEETVALLKERGVKGVIDMLLERSLQAANDADGCLMIVAAQVIDLVYKAWPLKEKEMLSAASAV